MQEVHVAEDGAVHPSETKIEGDSCKLPAPALDATSQRNQPVCHTREIYNFLSRNKYVQGPDFRALEWIEWVNIFYPAGWTVNMGVLMERGESMGSGSTTSSAMALVQTK